MLDERTQGKTNKCCGTCAHRVFDKYLGFVCKNPFDMMKFEEQTDYEDLCEDWEER